MTITPLHEYRFIDKSTWGPGPWQEEPDKVQWQDEPTGLACLAVRHPQYGHWCGYVGVPESHPAFGLGYEEVEHIAPTQPEDNWLGFDVHGGLTFADLCQDDPDAKEHGICHIPAPGEPDRVWWLGFDASHAWDRSPGREALYRSLGIPAFRGLHSTDEYRTLEYVQAECTKLARQLHDVR